MVQVNPELVGLLEEAGLKFVGKDESGKRMEVGFLKKKNIYWFCSEFDY